MKGVVRISQPVEISLEYFFLFYLIDDFIIIQRLLYSCMVENLREKAFTDFKGIFKEEKVTLSNVLRVCPKVRRVGFEPTNS